jgi:hypothetical protein
MGYDYGKEFRRTRAIRTTNFRQLWGDIEWNGNFITFLDAMLQSMAFVAPFRKMMVPVMIKSLRCDPRVFFETVVRNRVAEMDEELEENYQAELGELSAMQTDQGESASAFLTESDKKELKHYLYERYHLYKSNVPFHFDSECRLLVTHGIEVENVMAFPIPRKLDAQDLRLEAYEFVTNEDMCAIEPYDRKLVTDYIEVKAVQMNWWFCFKKSQNQ